MYSVVNQYGRYISGNERDRIIDAMKRDETELYIDGRRVEIVRVVSENDRRVIFVEVSPL